MSGSPQKVPAPISRIAERFALLKKHKRSGLVAFVSANDPNPEVFAEIFEGLPSAGADIIEVGIPFSDPAADGPAIQLASQRALKHNTTVATVLKAVEKFREDEIETPVVLMGYYNPIYHFGPQEFAEQAARAGVDGVIVVDLPPEEAEELDVHLRANNIHLIFLAAPTSSDARLPVIVSRASGFVYYVSITGITGTATADEHAVAKAVARLRKHTHLPVAVGFGIRTPEQAATIARLADGVVVGSAIVNVIAAMPGAAPERVVKAVTELCTSLAQATHKSGKVTA